MLMKIKSLKDFQKVCASYQNEFSFKVARAQQIFSDRFPVSAGSVTQETLDQVMFSRLLFAAVHEEEYLDSEQDKKEQTLASLINALYAYAYLQGQQDAKKDESHV